MKKVIVGICKLCKKQKPLTYEHIPPKSAFNNNTRFYELNSKDYYQNAMDYSEGKLKPKSRIEQGGFGNHCLCNECNGYLGQKYVRDYKKFAEISYGIINQYQDAKCYEFDISDINLLKFIKQIIAIFICCNNSNFTKTYDGLIEFVMDEKSNKLSDRYRIYMYLNHEGNIRNGNIMYTNLCGAKCEFTFKPFGFVLNMDNPKPILELSDVTSFKYYNPEIKHQKLMIKLNKYPTILPFPLDYRSKDEIK